MCAVDIPVKPIDITCIVFDFGFTLCSDLYFKVPPPECPNWQDLIQQNIFSDQALVDDWMKGAVTLQDIAVKLAPVVRMQTPRIVEFLEIGCRRLDFNQAVWNFAIDQREKGKKIAIVTGNMDVFTQVVVPYHHLADQFDVIINSFDYQELDKSVLWPKAFKMLGNGVGYSRSLLIEDGERNVMKFRENGGYTHLYKSEETFLAWLKSTGWQ